MIKNIATKASKESGIDNPRTKPKLDSVVVVVPSSVPSSYVGVNPSAVSVAD